ncbi:ferritin-like domain-containing protein [Micromonospora ureilytica]|uniref:ferritin-like domain-containing protein n=1 Tax=Micromonospora ureilytica TaxID=709868 RepID=UPI002E114A80|nr:ferritin-like domain-containing protein [Micromonospora ureilytica]
MVKRFIEDAIGRSGESDDDRQKLGSMVDPSNSTGQSADGSAPSDAAILNFALNLEYLEAEFYLRATTGAGLPDEMTTGTGTRGDVTGGSAVNFSNPMVRKFAREIASDEQQHVAFLRAALGEHAVSRPAISLDASFTAAAMAAGLIKSGETFDPYANDLNFLFAAFLFEDVGVSALKGAAPMLSNKTYLDASAGILATEAYHAGIVRTALFSEGMINEAVFAGVQKLSDARNSLDGPTDDDQGIGTKDEPNFIPTDSDGIAYGRSAPAILNVVYLNPKAVASGGFYPSGINGDIVMSAGAAA